MKQTTWEHFTNKEGSLANRLVDYYEGDQLKYVKLMMDGALDNGMGKRDEWRERGFIPRQRNITKAIVDKRAPLFNKPPSLEVWAEGANRPAIDQTLSDILYKANWQEFFANVDTYTSLLKTTYVLQQKWVAPGTETSGGIYRFNIDQDFLMLTLLHRGNAVVQTDYTGHIITEVAWLTSPITQEGFTYRVITLEAVIDVTVEGELETVTVVGANTDGIIPITAFHDTAAPRKGCWNKVPEDLPSMQEMVNLMITDTEFAAAHQKQKTLFTDTQIINNDKSPKMHALRSDPNAYQGRQGQEDSRPVPGEMRKNIGGLGSIVHLKPGVNGQAPMVEFKGPESDLSAMNTIMGEMIDGVASDWSVQLSMAGRGSATSGFQLVVQEMPNLQLREKRSQMFQGAMSRFYKTMQVLYPELMDGMLIVRFAPPNLPVNQREVEELWTLKITAGRASTVDYFVDTLGLTREEAISKVQEIVRMEEIIKAARGIVQTPPAQSTETEEEGNGNESDEQDEM